MESVVCATGHPGDHDLICPSSIDINKELSPERFFLRIGKDSAVPDGFVKVLSIRNIPVKNGDLLNEKFWAVRRYRREPQDDCPRCAWMPKEVFFLLGGTQEHCDMIPCDDSGKVVES